MSEAFPDMTCSLCGAPVTADDYCEAVGELFCAACLESLLAQRVLEEQP